MLTLCIAATCNTALLLLISCMNATNVCQHATAMLLDSWLLQVSLEQFSTWDATTRLSNLVELAGATLPLASAAQSHPWGEMDHPSSFQCIPQSWDLHN